jgi:hypothetical protein
MVSQLRLFGEKVERDLELELGVSQVQKRNMERKECEEKEKKRKEARSDQHIKGCVN